jgi:hypothetical protein
VTKSAGSASGYVAGSISHKYGSKDPHPDPYKNVTGIPNIRIRYTALDMYRYKYSRVSILTKRERKVQGCGSGSYGSTLFFEAGSGFVLMSKYKSFLEAQHRAAEGRGRSQWRAGGLKWSPGGSIDH